jgi:uncharacterized membrane protein
MIWRMLGMTDDRAEAILAQLLRAGVILSALIVLAGGVMYVAQHGRQETRGWREWHSEPSEIRSLAGTFGSAAHGDSASIIQLGLIFLIATPVARVIASVLVFLLKRDYLYVAFTLIVLGVLLYSLTGGRLE